MRPDEMAHAYYRWLLDKIRMRDYGHYERVLHYMFNREFYWVVPMDRNRYIDGLALRDEFAMEVGIQPYFWRGYLPDWCTVLEMMVALAEACEDRLMGDPDFGDRTHIWFWIMMNKLDLDSFTDVRFNEDCVEKIINRVLERSFQPDGKGGLFGRLKHGGDMRDIEWWYQLNYYINEHYAF